MSLSIALTNRQGKHVGFVLIAGVENDYGSKSGEWRGQCIFMALPSEPTMFSDAAYLELAERKQLGEHSVRISNDGAVISFVASDANGERFYATVSSDGPGDWGTISNGARTVAGRAVFTR